MLSGGLWGKQAWAECQSTRLAPDPRGQAAQRVSLAFGLEGTWACGVLGWVPLYSVVWVSTQLRKDGVGDFYKPLGVLAGCHGKGSPGRCYGALTNHRGRRSSPVHTRHQSPDLGTWPIFAWGPQALGLWADPLDPLGTVPGLMALLQPREVLFL